MRSVWESSCWGSTPPHIQFTYKSYAGSPSKQRHVLLKISSVKFEVILRYNSTKGTIKSGAIIRIGGAQKRADGVAGAKYSVG